MNNWAYNLDLLAQNGVIDYDAASDIRGQNPRYVGNPEVIPSQFIEGKPNTSNLEQPKTDEFKSPNNNPIHNPSWKKLLFGALALGGLAFGGYKIGKKFFPKTFDFSKVKTFFNDKRKATGDFFKNCWSKFTGLFKKKT